MHSGIYELVLELDILQPASSTLQRRVTRTSAMAVESDGNAAQGSAIPAEPLPYWLVNVPRPLWPTECPSFLRDLPPKSIQCLSTPDELYQRQPWDYVKESIGQFMMDLCSNHSTYKVTYADRKIHYISTTENNRLDRFHRVPSDLRKYLEYTTKIKEKYGSVMRFVVKERLCWGDGDMADLKPKGKPFEFDGSWFS